MLELELKPAPTGSEGSLAIEVADPLLDGKWDAFLHTHPEALSFHSTAWAQVLKATYGHHPLGVVAAEHGQVAGCLAVTEVSSRWTGRRGVSVAFADVCPALTSEGASYADLLNSALQAGRARGWRYFEARGVPADKAMPASLCFAGHQLDLQAGEEKLYANLHSELRTAIRKAEKAGVQVQFCTSESSMAAYYALHCKTRRKHGLPPQPYKFFQNIHRYLIAKGMGVVALAAYEQKPIAGAVFLFFGRKAFYKFGASDQAFQHLRGNSLVLWKAIQNFTAQSLSSLHFGRSRMQDEGLRRFKRSFGAVEQMIQYIKYDFGRESFVTDRDQTSGWHNRVFRWMPSPWARWLGALLYNHLS